MSFFCQEFSSASHMEVDEQSQPQLRDTSTTQIVQSTITPKQESHNEAALHANVPNNGNPHLPDGENPSRTTNVKDEALNENLVDEEFFNRLPPGYRFNPTDAELILYYLKPKTENKQLPRNQIRHENLYQYSPDEITARYKESAESEWYFFTPRDRKYPNGNRPNRAAGTGYWKATGADKPIVNNGEEIGFRKALVFYEGKPPKGTKTGWIMHEYRVKGGTPKKKSEVVMRLDDYILCRIYKKSDKLFRSRQRGEAQSLDIQGDEDLAILNDENEASCNIGYSNEFMNPYGEHLQFSQVMDTPVAAAAPPNIHLQQPALNKRIRPLNYPSPTNFNNLVYSTENVSGENLWFIPENQSMINTQELWEPAFPDTKYEVGLPELDNMLISMYPPTDDLSIPSLDNQLLPKRD